MRLPKGQRGYEIIFSIRVQNDDKPVMAGALGPLPLNPQNARAEILRLIEPSIQGLEQAIADPARFS